MPLFRRRREPQVPEWASFMSPGEYGEITATVSAEVAALGVDWRWSDGAIVAHLDDGPLTMGLANVAQLAHAAERADRPEVIRSHFTRVIELHGRDRSDTPFSELAPLLKVRLWAEADLPPDVPLVARPVAEGLIAVLCIDWPEEVSTVSAEEADAWGPPREELWELAARNTRDDRDIEVEVMTPADDQRLPLVVCTGDSFFSSSRALWPEDLVPEDPPAHGLLAAVPNRHLAALCPIVDARIIEVISWLSTFVHDRYVEGPGSISSDLYWVQESGWVRLPVEAGGARVQFFPPDAFLAVMNRLAGEAR